jgi:hypothetical protein
MNQHRRITLALNEESHEPVDMKALIQAGQHLLSIIDAVDKSVHERREASLGWEIADAHAGSMTVTLEPRAEAEDAKPDVVEDAVVRGLSLIEQAPERPHHWPNKALEEASALARLRQKSLSDITVRLENGAREREPVFVAPGSATVEHVKSLLQKTEMIGSVEGRLESINLHEQRSVGVWDVVTGLRVQCSFPESLLDEVREALGERVLASGRLSLDEEGHPTHCRIQRIRRLRSRDELPNAREMFGVDPELTGDEDSVSYIERGRE